MVRAGHRLDRLLQASDGGRVGADLPARSLVFDLIVAAVFAGLAAVLLQVLARTADADDVVFVLLVSVPLVIRRRFPRSAMVAVTVVSLAQMMLGVPIGFHDAAVLVVLYTAVGCTDQRFGLVALGLGLVLVGVGAGTGWWGYIDRRLAAPGAWVRLATTLGAALLVFVTWALGVRFRSARLGAIALAERAGQLEREREQQALLVAAAERARIAREMHDVIAHGLSVMIVQADGAAYVVDQAPETARQALEQISATGRESLAEMRNLLGLLRSDDPGSTPQPDLGDLAELVGQARSAGAEITLESVGDLGSLPAMVSLTAYRIVQEGLTNARRHGGPGVRVELRRVHDELTVRVSNDGPVGAGRLTGPPGHGLTGVRERVAAVGGRVTAEPDDAGGFVVQAWLPTGGSIR